MRSHLLTRHGLAVPDNQEFVALVRRSARMASDNGHMSINGVSRSSGVVGVPGDEAVELSPEGQAEIQRLQAERALLAGEKILNEEDPFAKLERGHQNALAAQRAIGAKSALANMGKGPKAGDPGVGALVEFVPVALKA